MLFEKKYPLPSEVLSNFDEIYPRISKEAIISSAFLDSEELLRSRGIMIGEETPADVFKRVTEALIIPEVKFWLEKEYKNYLASHNVDLDFLSEEWIQDNISEDSLYDKKSELIILSGKFVRWLDETNAPHLSSFISQNQEGYSQINSDFLGYFEEKTRNLLTIDEFVEKNQVRLVEYLEELQSEILDLLTSKKVIFGSPILTYAGRDDKNSLSSSGIPFVAIKGDFPDNLSEKDKTILLQFSNQGMGVGFNVSEVKNIDQAALYLNELYRKNWQENGGERPPAGMIVCDVYDKNIVDLINLKRGANSRGEKWVFNISINVDDKFMEAAKDPKKTLTTTDGRQIKPYEILMAISEASCECGDPGIVNLKRWNERNPLPNRGDLNTPVSCADVSNVMGDATCFAYINLAEMIGKEEFRDEYLKSDFGRHNKKLDGEYRPLSKFVSYSTLAKSVERLVRILDNAVELSLDAYPDETKDIVGARRGISVGVMGMSEFLIKRGLAYDSPEAKKLISNVINVINFVSKRTSIELAVERGAPLLLDKVDELSDVTGEKSILERFKGASPYGEKYQLQGRDDMHNLCTFSLANWLSLIRKGDQHGFRNFMTTAGIPQTGFTARLLKVTGSIEPVFSLSNGKTIYPALEKFLKENNIELSQKDRTIILETGSVQTTSLPQNVKDLFKTALEIEVEQQLGVVKAVIERVDGSVSKTANFSSNATLEDFYNMFVTAHNMGLLGITGYRDGSHGEMQPSDLGVAKAEPKPDIKGFEYRNGLIKEDHHLFRNNI